MRATEGEGDCFYHAVSQALGKDVQTLRGAVAQHLRQEDRVEMRQCIATGVVDAGVMQYVGGPFLDLEHVSIEQLRQAIARPGGAWFQADNAAILRAFVDATSVLPLFCSRRGLQQLMTQSSEAANLSWHNVSFLRPDQSPRGGLVIVGMTGEHFEPVAIEGKSAAFSWNVDTWPKWLCADLMKMRRHKAVYERLLLFI